MLNCEWGNEKPWTKWRDEWVRDVKRTGSPLILSLSGRDVESCAALIGEFSKIGVGLLERPDEKPYHFGRSYAVTPAVLDRLRVLSGVVSAEEV